jgi:hypothetical protein
MRGGVGRCSPGAIENVSSPGIVCGSAVLLWLSCACAGAPASNATVAARRNKRRKKKGEVGFIGFLAASARTIVLIAAC